MKVVLDFNFGIDVKVALRDAILLAFVEASPHFRLMIDSLLAFLKESTAVLKESCLWVLFRALLEARAENAGEGVSSLVLELLRPKLFLFVGENRLLEMDAFMRDFLEVIVDEVVVGLESDFRP